MTIEELKQEAIDIIHERFASKISGPFLNAEDIKNLTEAIANLERNDLYKAIMSPTVMNSCACSNDKYEQDSCGIL